jgi:hypothetical protein
MSGEMWFRPKRYGYGATPVTWKGWAFIGLTVLAQIATALLFLPRHRAAFFLSLFVWLVALAVVARLKTEGEWHWRWGVGRGGR